MPTKEQKKFLLCIERIVNDMNFHNIKVKQIADLKLLLTLLENTTDKF